MPSQPASDSLRGLLERIRYSNEEDGYLIADLRPDDSNETVTIVGKLPGVQCGETLKLRGHWSKHSVHGSQFKALEYNSFLPASVYGIRKYLGSGLVKGVSKGLANRIVDRFGDSTLKIISEESARLQEVGGIGKQRAKAIKEAWDEQSHIRDLSLFLTPYGVTPSQTLKIHNELGFLAIDLIKENPFRLAREIRGIGFKTCDRIALNMGLGNESGKRVDAGIEFVMHEIQDEGHTAWPLAELATIVAEKLEIDEATASAGIYRVIENRAIDRIDVIPDEAHCQLPYTNLAESRIAHAIHRLLSGGSELPPIKIERAIHWAEEKAGFDFADQQKEAIRTALDNKISIITGGPGTGKTTILRAIVSILKAKKVNPLLAAPTGRAAQRLSESAGAFAQTIHRLLKFDPSAGAFTINKSKPLNAQFVIVDESSMLDTRIASSLCQAIPNTCHLLLVGDVDQLPSVGSGNVLKDIINCQQAPLTRLDRIFRQSKKSSIVRYAHSINRGIAALPEPVDNSTQLDPDEDFQFVRAKDQPDCSAKVLEVCEHFVGRRLALDPVSESQVLAPMHRGESGVANLNTILQSRLNQRTTSIKLGGSEFKVGDKVIQNRNNYDLGVFNGDIGIIESVNLEDGSLSVDFDRRSVQYQKTDLIDLALAYAVSIHKSQGSEYPVVIIPLLKAHFMMLQRNLIYTAVTRGRKKAIIVGDPAAFAMAVRSSESKTRRTLLKERLSYT